MVNSSIYVTKRMFDYYEQDEEAYLGSPDERRQLEHLALQTLAE